MKPVEYIDERMRVRFDGWKSLLLVMTCIYYQPFDADDYEKKDRITFYFKMQLKICIFISWQYSPMLQYWLTYLNAKFIIKISFLEITLFVSAIAFYETL